MHERLLSARQLSKVCTHLRKSTLALTALFKKIKFRDPAVMPAWDVLRMATVEGAQAIGLGKKNGIGSLEAGKQADLILVDLSALNLSPVLDTPVRNILPNLVYAASGHEVKTVMVAGRVLVRDGQVLTADEAAVRAEAQAQAEAVAQRVAADPVHKGMALLAAMEAGRL
jgi:5-methylthioadenosine/S-adenosylhomocysteine deaminase